MKIYFDILHLYYLPQYEPVSEALEKHNVECTFVLYKQEFLNDVLADYARERNLKTVWVDNEKEATQLYLNDKPDWVIFGNAFPHADELVGKVKTALMQHGIGPKACYYDVSESPISVRFVEGEHRLNRLKERFPEKTFIDSGYAKLDPIVNKTTDEFDLVAAGLDPNKKTLLYAPTFYPSSIECLPKDFPEQLSEFNIIIKPHFFSFIKANYKKQRDRLEKWEQYNNTYVATPKEASILPFMSIADILISDASSTLFEFTALDKPAIWCDFYKLRWSYRGPLKFRFTRRLDKDIQLFADVADQTKSFKELITAIRNNVKNPNAKQSERLRYRELLTGLVDGKCSARIADYLVKNID